MKKIWYLCLAILLLTCGCGKFDQKNALKEFENDVNNSKSYIIKGSMEIISNEEKFNYSLEVNYLKDDFYKVILVNQTNNHEQVILRNKDGVYVVTPSLNKSFKFQSEWPDNSSQAYILNSILKDLKNDKDLTLEKTDSNYILKSQVIYPNNTELAYQKVYFDKKMNIESVIVYDENDSAKITVKMQKVNLKGRLDENDFLLEDLIDENCCTEDENCDKTDCQNNSNCTTDECKSKNTTNIIDEIIYPLYIPSETYLTGSEKIDTDSGNRVILTFAGEKNFVLVEEAATKAEEFEIIPIYGDPHISPSSIIAIGTNSLYWTDNNIEYYLTSNDLNEEEMINIAESLGNNISVGESK